ncbi:MAG TPA: hypothetical protein VFL91_33085 [Thermomicrobiales bacterium]|nr:hypothetical protein [Thermomicrobiales bacterium]
MAAPSVPLSDADVGLETPGEARVRVAYRRAGRAVLGALASAGQWAGPLDLRRTVGVLAAGDVAEHVAAARGVIAEPGDTDAGELDAALAALRDAGYDCDGAEDYLTTIYAGVYRDLDAHWAAVEAVARVILTGEGVTA